jgi:AraC-like DNA-binding protein
MSVGISNNLHFDVIGDVLETLRFRASIFFRSDLSAPWGFSFPSIEFPRFHIALFGDFFVGVEGEGAVNIEEMGIATLPIGGAHWVADKPGRQLLPSENINQECELSQPIFSQGQITNRLMCGVVHYDLNAKHPILDLLPHLLHFPAFKTTDPIWILVMLIDGEIQRTKSNKGGIIDRLTEALFIKLIHHHIDESEEIVGFLAALRDRRVNQALMLIHQYPHVNWSLSSLSERVGMSRSTLTRSFQNTVGVAPMAYTSNWRLAKAYSLIKHTDINLEEVAELVGFVSARTLTKAFRRQYNYTPSQLRKKLSTVH